MKAFRSACSVVVVLALIAQYVHCDISSCEQTLSGNLEVLNCSYRALTEVPDGIPTNTKFLLLQGNEISVLKSDDFSDLDELFSIDVSDNAIVYVDEDTFLTQWLKSTHGPNASSADSNFLSLDMTGNPSECELISDTEKKVECTCDGKVGTSTACAQQTETTSSTSSTLSEITTEPSTTTTGSGDDAGDDVENDEDGNQDLESSGEIGVWTRISLTTRGCCISSRGTEYDSYTYTASLEECRSMCESEIFCRGIEYPWHAADGVIEETNACDLLFDDGKGPTVSPEYSESKTYARGTGPVAGNNRFCRPELQCHQLCRPEDNCDQFTTIARPQAESNAVLELVFDHPISDLESYIQFDFSVFKSDAVKVFCEYTDLFETEANCLNEMVVVVTSATENEFQNATVFSFHFARRGDEDEQPVHSIKAETAFALSKSDDDNGVKMAFDFSSFTVYTTVTTTMTTATTFGTPNDDDDEFERNMIIVGVVAAVVILMCLIAYTLARVRDLTKALEAVESQEQQQIVVSPVGLQGGPQKYAGGGSPYAAHSEAGGKSSVGPESPYRSPSVPDAIPANKTPISASPVTTQSVDAIPAAQTMTFDPTTGAMEMSGAPGSEEMLISHGLGENRW